MPAPVEVVVLGLLQRGSQAQTCFLRCPWPGPAPSVVSSSSLFPPRSQTRVLHVGFYCKHFSYTGNQYSFFEKQVCIFYEEQITDNSAIASKLTVIRASLLWCMGSTQRQSPSQSLKERNYNGTGTHLNFPSEQNVVAKGSVPSCTSCIAELAIIPIPMQLIPPPKVVTVGLWGLIEWSQHLVNARFTDGSSTTDGTKANGKLQLIDWPKLRKEP